MLADALAVSVFVTESAIALYEAQATNRTVRKRRKHKQYPRRLRPTVDQYTALYSEPSPDEAAD